MTRIVARRGSSGRVPENTLAAFGVWTVDDPDTMARLVQEYPTDRITANDPERLLCIVKKQAAAL